MTYAAEQFINLKDYPIDQDNEERSSLLASVRRDLQNDGCAVLKNFLTKQGIEALVSEADSVSQQAHRSFNRTNLYFTKDDPTLPRNDPRPQCFDRSNSFIPADNFAPDGPLRQVHNFVGFETFKMRMPAENLNMLQPSAKMGRIFKRSLACSTVRLTRLFPCVWNLEICNCFADAIHCIVSRRFLAKHHPTSLFFHMLKNPIWSARPNAPNSPMGVCCLFICNAQDCGRTPILIKDLILAGLNRSFYSEPKILQKEPQ